MEAETTKLRQEVFVIQERNGFLQSSVDEYRRQLENQQELATVMRSDYEKRLKDERDVSHYHNQAHQERVLQADSEKAQATKEAQRLHESLIAAQSELTTFREQVRNLQSSITERDSREKDLGIRNHALQVENTLLLERSNAIGARYNENDLVRFPGVIILNADSLSYRVSKKGPS